jgi:hypothetical protein
MSYIAATLLLQMDLEDAFITMIYILRQRPIWACCTRNENEMKRYAEVFSRLLAKYLPVSYIVFIRRSISFSDTLLEW